MSAPSICRSTDTGAPVLQGGPSSLLDLLDAVLRTGYGGAFATGTETSSGVTPTDGDTVTVGNVTYTFKTALTPTINQVLIGGSATNALANLARAVNRIGTPGTDYAAATLKNPDVICTAVTATLITFQARYPGTDGNSLALADTAATLTPSGATLAGGTQGKATGTLTSDNTVPANNDQVVLGNKTYTFKTVLTGAANEVFIGADADTTLNNLKDAINAGTGSGSGGGAGAEYGTGTTAHTQVTAGTVAAHALPVTAIYYGTAPNAYATTETSAHLSWGATTLTGGRGHDPVGWTKPYTGTDTAVFRQAAGNQFYLRVGDDGPGAGTYKEARIRGYEVKADALDTPDVNNTGPFPTVAQLATGCFVRKSTTVDVTARTYVVAADDRTLYVYISTGDVSATYYGFMFGDFYSNVAADGFRTMIIGRVTENTGVASNDVLAQLSGAGMLTLSGHYAARAYTGAGGSTALSKAGDGGKHAAIAQATTVSLRGVLTFPNITDGGFYVSPVWVCEGSNTIRGRMRGFWHWCQPTAAIADGDTFTAPASSPWAGRSFLVVRLSDRTGGDAVAGLYLIETTAWDTSS